MADRNNRFLSGLRYIGDRIAWGPKGGDRSFTPLQLLGGIGSRALNVLIPGAGTAANVLGNGYYGAGPLANTFHNPQTITRQGPEALSPFQPQLNLMPPSYGAPGSLNLPTQPGALTYEQMIQQLQNQYQPAAPAGPVYASGPVGRDMSQSWAGLAGGGTSQGGGIGHGWTGVSGPAAQSLWAGMRAGSDAAIQAQEMAWAKSQLQ